MPYTASIYQVFIASPSDVSEERSIVRDTIIGWNAAHAATKRLFLDPVGWESHSVPTIGDRPQAIINNQILHDADLLIGVFWTRLGTTTGIHPSGTVEEIEEHLAAKKPAMIYFSDAPVRPDKIDHSQYSALQAFRLDLQKRGLIESYSDQAEFARKLDRQLNQLINKEFSGFTASNDSPRDTSSPNGPTDISEDALAILTESVKTDGVVVKLRHMNGVHIQVGDGVVDTTTPRLAAKWGAAVDELVERDYIRDRGYKGETFDVTDVGYRAIASFGAIHE